MAEFFDDLDKGVLSFDAASLIPVDPTWRPAADFVICRDASGKTTAAYGWTRWDINPIRLKANTVAVIGFDTVFEEFVADQQPLIEEVRYLLFCLLFYVNSGHLGRISAGMLYQYFMTLRTAARFCYGMKDNPLVGVISLEDLFTNPAYLNAYKDWMDKTKVGGTRRKLTGALISHMVAIGEERLGYKLNGIFGLDFGRGEDPQQHPVIPTRIYLDVINSLGDWMDVLYIHKNPIERFLKCFEHEGYAYTINHQKVIDNDTVFFQPEFDQAVRYHKLKKVFTGDLSCEGRGVLSSAVLKIQWILKNVIHLYTGMRDQEVMRLPYRCLAQEEVVSATQDDEGKVRDKPMIVNVISSTTKFTGYRKSAAWLATDEVVRAVEIARAICRAISHLFGVNHDDMPLFLNPAIINRADTKIGVSNWNEVSKPQFLLTRYIIQVNDLDELQVTDPSRDFASDARFHVGMPWRLTSHQFRRSLAFYGSSSGFISLPSLRKQFKHLSTQMTRYYANNFAKLKTIFGYYDEKLGDFVLPKNHVLFEYQTGVPMNIAYDLLSHAFGDEAPLFGGVGSYISNQRGKVATGDIHIVDLREETEKQAEDGKISYRPTFLGACTKTGKCETFLLGEITPCLSCKDGILEQDKLESAIADDEADLALYEPGSGEYQVIETELLSLKKFHQQFIPVHEVY
ncbi:integrase [Pseudomonas koreensis]|nr:integrase [Pseudomonas koreensis]PYB97935.1 integrase [Pseudomonas koreensis]